MIKDQGSISSGPEELSVTDHREIEWQFDTDDWRLYRAGYAQRETDGSVEATMKKAARRLDTSSSPEDFHDTRKKGKRLRYTLKKGKQWKKFEKVLEDHKALDVPDAGVR